MKKDLKEGFAKIDKEIQKLKTEIILIKWTLVLVLVAVVIPILQNIFRF